MINNNIKDRFAYLIYAICAVAIIYLVFSLTPFLIGPWESYHIYNSFSEIYGPPIKMTIQVGANTAGHYGDNYGLINSWAYIVRKLHLTINLFNIRFISVLSGFISLLLFYKISSRWFGRNTSFMITALLAVNETFLLFEHYLLPQMFTFAAILFLLERFQVLYEKTDKIKILVCITFGLAASLCAMNYLLSRLFLIFIFILQLKMVFTDKFHFKISRETVSINLKKLFATWVSYLAFLGIFHISNIAYTFKKVFIFSDLGEYSTGTSSFISNTLYNIPFMAKHVFLDIPFLKPSLPYFILGDAKYHLITFPILFLTLLGLLIALKHLKTFENALILYITGMMFFIMNMSMVYPVFPDGTQTTTLSSFRTFYMLLPIFLLVGVFYKKLSQILQRRMNNHHLLSELIMFFIPFFILGFYSNLRSYKGLNSFYKSNHFDFKEEAPRKKYTDQELKENLNMNFRLTEIQDGIYYRNQVYLKMLADKIQTRLMDYSTPLNSKIFINLPIEKYTPAYYDLCCSLRVKPYLKTFLSIYLFDLGIRNNYFESNGLYRFKEAQVYISVNEKEKNQILKDFPGITELTIN